MKEPLAQSVTLAAIRMLSLLVLEFLVLQDAISLLSQKGTLESLHPSPDSSIPPQCSSSCEFTFTPFLYDFLNEVLLQFL